MRVALLFCSLTLAAAGASAQADGALTKRLLVFADQLTAAGPVSPAKLADADLELLEQAQLDPRDLPPGAAEQILVVLRFGRSLREEELPAAIAFAGTAAGRTTAWLMA